MCTVYIYYVYINTHTYSISFEHIYMCIPIWRLLIFTSTPHTQSLSIHSVSVKISPVRDMPIGTLHLPHPAWILDRINLARFHSRNLPTLPFPFHYNFLALKWSFELHSQAVDKENDMKLMNTQYTHIYYVNKNFILDAIHRFTPLVKTLC